MQESELGYIAALVDSLAKLTSRTVHRHELPVVTIQGKYEILPWLASGTGVQLMKLDKGYARHQCSEHCPEKHMVIASWTYRWQLVGARATILLDNIYPFLRLQRATAGRLIELGQDAGAKAPTIEDMKRLGFTTGEHDEARTPQAGGSAHRQRWPVDEVPGGQPGHHLLHQERRA